MKNMLKIGIIGAGGICEGIHLPAINDIELCEPIWICDIVESKAQKFAG